MFRWRERYFVLTRDYISCFKKGSSRITEMGGFVFKVRGLLQKIKVALQVVFKDKSSITGRL